MSQETAGFLAAAVLIITAYVLSEFDKAAQRKADRDRERWENDAIDLTGGNR